MIGPVPARFCHSNHTGSSGSVEPVSHLDMVFGLHRTFKAKTGLLCCDDDASTRSMLKRNNTETMKNNGTDCWNVQLCLAVPFISFHFISRASVQSHSREPGQSWKPALTGSSFQLIWLANLISTQSPVAQSQFPLDFPSHGSPGVLIQHPTEITSSIFQLQRVTVD